MGLPTDAVRTYDFASSGWSSSIPLPNPIGPANALASAVYGSQLFVAGGHRGSQVLAYAAVYSPWLSAWTLLTPMPTARYFAAAAVVNDTLFVIGGRGANGNALPTVEVRALSPTAACSFHLGVLDRNRRMDYQGCATNCSFRFVRRRGGRPHCAYWRQLWCALLALSALLICFRQRSY